MQCVCAFPGVKVKAGCGRMFRSLSGREREGAAQGTRVVAEWVSIGPFPGTCVVRDQRGSDCGAVSGEASSCGEELRFCWA